MKTYVLALRIRTCCYSMASAMDIVEVTEHIVDADELQWRDVLMKTMRNKHDNHNELSYLLEEPRRKRHYTLDFATTVMDK